MWLFLFLPAMKILKSLLAIVLAAIFIFSAYSKLEGMDAFEVYLFRTTFLGFDAAAVTARLLLAAELLTALLLLTRLRYRLGWWLGMLMTLVFSIFLSGQWLQGEEGNCYCFGELMELSPAESLLKNVFIIILFLLARGLTALKFKGEKWVFGILTVSLLILPFIFSPPDIFLEGRFKPAEHDQLALNAAIDSNYIPADFVHERKLIAFYSTGCRYCQMSSERISAMMRKNEISADKLNVVFWGDSINPQEFYDKTHSMDFDFTSLATKPYLKITKGRMPLVLLVKNGEVVDQMNYRTLDEEVLVDFLNTSE